MAGPNGSFSKQVVETLMRDQMETGAVLLGLFQDLSIPKTRKMFYKNTKKCTYKHRNLRRYEWMSMGKLILESFRLWFVVFYSCILP